MQLRRWCRKVMGLQTFPEPARYGSPEVLQIDRLSADKGCRVAVIHQRKLSVKKYGLCIRLSGPTGKALDFTWSIYSFIKTRILVNY